MDISRTSVKILKLKKTSVGTYYGFKTSSFDLFIHNMFLLIETNSRERYWFGYEFSSTSGRWDGRDTI